MGPKKGIPAYVESGNANEPTNSSSANKGARERIFLSYRFPPCVGRFSPTPLSGIVRTRVHRIMVVHRSPKPTVQVRFLVGPPKQKPPLWGRFLFRLALRFFKKHPLAQCGVELHDFNLARNALLILARPDYMVGLRGFKPEQAVL